MPLAHQPCNECDVRGIVGRRNLCPRCWREATGSDDTERTISCKHLGISIHASMLLDKVLLRHGVHPETFWHTAVEAVSSWEEDERDWDLQVMESADQYWESRFAEAFRAERSPRHS